MQYSSENDFCLSKERCSATTTDSLSGNAEPEGIFNDRPVPSIPAIFAETPQAKSISSKLTKKGANWLLSIAWIKDYCAQSGWTALMLFYGYKAQRNFKKTQLESLLLVCLQLATKLHQSVPLRTSDLLLCCASPILKGTLVELEAEVLELFGYDVFLPTTLETVTNGWSLEEEQVVKVIFLSELYLTQTVSILFDAGKFQRIVDIVKMTPKSREYSLELLEIQEMAFDPINKFICNKFGSKFDIELFLRQIQ